MTKDYFLGLDVSKGYADIIILNKNKKELEPSFQLDDTFEGHVHLFKILSELQNRKNTGTIYAALESTGGYENNWFNSLKRFQGEITLKAARLNPLGVHYEDKADLKRVITDRTSAKSIAEYMITHPEKVEFDQDETYTTLRRQKTFITMLKKQKAQLLNQLESLYYTSFPEIVAYCKDSTPRWVLLLLQKYPTAEKLKRAKPELVSRIPYVSIEKAKELILTAQESVASACDNVMETLVKDTIGQVLHLRKQIQEQTKKLASNCDIPEVKILKSYIGIDDWTAIGLMLEIGSVERFSAGKKLVSYFGIHPAYKQSGDGTSKIRMSKKGRIEGRRLLYMAAMSGVQYNPVLKKLYARLLARGMNSSAAIGVCMHKTLRIIYGMLKNKTTFDPEIDKANTSKKVETKINNYSQKDRRYQKFDSKAPISRRQNKKRKAGKMHQNVNNIECGVNQPA